jgi:hypothetical protein
MRKSVWILVVAVTTLLSCTDNDEIEKQIAVFREETIVLPEFQENVEILMDCAFLYVLVVTASGKVCVTMVQRMMLREYVFAEHR